MSLQQYQTATGGREITNQACALACPVSLGDLAGILGLGPQALGMVAGRGETMVKRVCIDSRAAGPDTLFVALKGARTDGHAYLEDIARAGCIAALVSFDFAAGQPEHLRSLATEHGLVALIVADPLRSLQEWASAWLGTLQGLVRVGVTGSNGKTTTKELLQQVLSVRKRVFASPGNLNSVIGLPLAALAVEPGTGIAVFEMAMSERGEMQRLARLVFPDLAIITNIGTAHIGNIGSQEAIALEKKQIFSAFDGLGVAFIPGDDDFAHLLASGVKGSVIRFGEHDTAGYQGWEAWESGQILKWGGETIHLHAAGRHVRSDALAAISLAVHLGMEAADIRQGLEAWRPAFGRNELLEGRMRVVQDCYNANPDSMKAAIEAFMEQDPGAGGRAMVLGDMRELGSHSADAHAELGRRLADLPIDVLLLFGTEVQATWQAWHSAGGTAARGSALCAQFEELARRAENLLQDGDLVLLKASRGMELERLTPVLLGPDNHSRTH